jgi:hypothetical protein
VVPQALEQDVLDAMGWTTKSDLPPGVTDLDRDQARAVLEALNEPRKEELIYCVALYRDE